MHHMEAVVAVVPPAFPFTYTEFAGLCPLSIATTFVEANAAPVTVTLSDCESRAPPPLPPTEGLLGAVKPPPLPPPTALKMSVEPCEIALFPPDVPGADVPATVTWYVPAAKRYWV